MKKNLLSFLAFLIINFCFSQTNWNADLAHSSIVFSVSHFKISKVVGNFNKFNITTKTQNDFKNPAFEVTIDASSIDTNQKSRDNHLKSSDFFDVAKFPNIKFASDKFDKLNDDDFSVTGKIILKGISKEITFKGKINGIISDSKGKQKAGLSLKTVIKRETFKIGSKMSPIGNDVSVTINLQLHQQ